MNEKNNLQEMFIEDAPQDVNNLTGVEHLSDLVIQLQKLEDEIVTSEDHLLLTGDPAIIGVACSIVSDMTNGRYNLLKWDKQERQYYPIAINLYERGKIDE